MATKKKLPSWDKNNTGFVDSNGHAIRGGMVVEYWDNEGGDGVGVVDFQCKEWRILNPWREKECGFKIITQVAAFAPANIRVLGIRGVEISK